MVLPLLLMVPVFVAGAVLPISSSCPRLNFLLGFNADQFNIQIRGSEYYGFRAHADLGRDPVPDPGRDDRRQLIVTSIAVAVLVIAVLAMLLPGTTP